MSLKCKNCGSRNTTVVSAKELSDRTGDSSLDSLQVGFIPKESIGSIIAAITAIAVAVGKFFSFSKEKEKSNRKVVLCKNCGYWEKV